MAIQMIFSAPGTALDYHFQTHFNIKSSCSCRRKKPIHISYGAASSAMQQQQQQDEDEDEEKEEEEKTSYKLPVHINHISSVSNPFIKRIVKLRQDSAYREAAARVILIGSIPLKEICKSNRKDRDFRLELLLVNENSKISRRLTHTARRIVTVTDNVILKVAGVKTAESTDCIGILPLPSRYLKLNHTLKRSQSTTLLHSWCPQPHRVLILDGVQDPGNLGTLLRTAAAFGWDGAYLLPGCCDPFNDKAMRASRGACFKLPIALGSWEQLKDYANKHEMKLYAGNPTPEIEGEEGEEDDEDDEDEDTECRSVQELVAENSVCLVLGREGKGISQKILRNCNQVSIPMPGAFDSLNVAVVGGIFMYLLMKK